MTGKFLTLRRAVEENEFALNRSREELNAAIKNCSHKWGPVEPDFIHEGGYTIPGDPPGTMGVDWRGPCYVEPKTTKRWKRTCQVCGEVQHTFETKKEVIEHPSFEWNNSKYTRIEDMAGAAKLISSILFSNLCEKDSGGFIVFLILTTLVGMAS
jgi:hypothetical protein